jgi:Zn-finger nucleic acid-binding protein
MCGASASTDAGQCAHCGARLATVACPSCFGLIFAGAKFCSHCGGRADRSEKPGAADQRCPRCGIGLEAVSIGETELRECGRCEGVWLEVDALERICTDREKQGTILGAAAPLTAATNPGVEKVRYLACPVCRKLMNRVNFARCSQVVVDVCKGHGTWFDKDELRRIVEFIRAGGIDKAREREMAELEQRRREVTAAQVAPMREPPLFSRTTHYNDWGYAVRAAASLLRTLLR